MQYIFSQEEYNEYIELKRIAQRKRALTKRQQSIVDYYVQYPSSTYQEASKVIGISGTAIFNHIVKMEKEGHVIRKNGKIFII